jgi:hypothetical protein
MERKMEPSGFARTLLSHDDGKSWQLQADYRVHLV